MYYSQQDLDIIAIRNFGFVPDLNKAFSPDTDWDSRIIVTYYDYEERRILVPTNARTRDLVRRGKLAYFQGLGMTEHQAIATWREKLPHKFDDRIGLFLKMVLESKALLKIFAESEFAMNEELKALAARWKGFVPREALELLERLMPLHRSTVKRIIDLLCEEAETVDV
jgi:hypothetical protein